MPIRVASKSVRCRAVLAGAFGLGGFAGIMVYSLREAIWLAGEGETDILLRYPTAAVGALRPLDREWAARIVLMVALTGVVQVSLDILTGITAVVPCPSTGSGAETTDAP